MEKFRIQCKNPECNSNKVIIVLDVTQPEDLKFVCQSCGEEEEIFNSISFKF